MVCKDAIRAASLIISASARIVTSLLTQYLLALEMKMKSAKIAVVACSLFAAAAVYAQSEAPAVGAPQHVEQSAAPQAAHASGRSESAKPAKKGECVGPVSFCNIYFGS